jgi:hypothetical protein
MEETPENGKESSYSAHAYGINERLKCAKTQLRWQTQEITVTN